MYNPITLKGELMKDSKFFVEFQKHTNKESGYNITDVKLLDTHLNSKGYFDVTYEVTYENEEVTDIIFKDVDNPFEVMTFDYDNVFRPKIDWMINDIYSDFCIFYKEREVKTVKSAKPLELTLDDISKKFGGREIKIVSKKEDTK